MSNKTVSIRLSPQGQLLLALPGQQDTLRDIVVRKDDAGETLVRILMALEMDRTEIGLDGAPTQAQVKHWERHGVWPDERCRFCLAEGRIRPSVQRHRSTRTVYKDNTGVEVRIIAAGKGGKKIQRARQSLEDLDL